MGSKSNYLENKVLDAVYGNQALPTWTNLYFALFTTTPSDSGGGTEVTGGSYTRATVANNLTNFPAAVGGSKSNAPELLFPVATAPWGTVVAWAVFDAVSGGNMLYWGPVTPNVAVVTGNQAKFFASTGLTITED